MLFFITLMTSTGILLKMILYGPTFAEISYYMMPQMSVKRKQILMFC